MPGENPLSILDMQDHAQVTSLYFDIAGADNSCLLDVPAGSDSSPSRDVVIDRVTFSAGAGSGSNGFTLKKAASGTAITAGTAISAAFDVSSTSLHTTYDLTLVDTENVIPKGYRIGLDVSGALGYTAITMQVYWRSKRR